MTDKKKAGIDAKIDPALKFSSARIIAHPYAQCQLCGTHGIPRWKHYCDDCSRFVPFGIAVAHFREASR